MLQRTLIVLVLLSGAATATTSQYDVTALERFVCDNIATQYQLHAPYHQVTLKRGAATLERLTEQEWDSLEIRALSKTTPKGAFPILIAAYLEGEVVERTQASVHVAVFDSVLTANHASKRGQLAADVSTSTEWVELTRVFENPIHDKEILAKKRLRRNLQRGALITLEALEDIPDVNVGEIVTITVSHGSVVITTQGAALQAGIVGEEIRVRPENTRKSLKTTITGPGAVSLSRRN